MLRRNLYIYGWADRLAFIGIKAIDLIIQLFRIG